MTIPWYLIPFAYLAGCILLWWAFRWVLLQIGKPRRPYTPIYGPADPYRRDGQQARPNVRLVRP